jgi:hypothetical protein
MLKYLTAALLTALAMSTPSKAVTINVGDVGASGTTALQGYVDVNGNAVSVPGLTGSLFLEYDGVTNGGLTWNFDYTVTNTQSGSVTASRITSFGLTTTPNIVGAASTGLFGYTILNPSFPNVNGANAIEVCFSSASGSCSGGTGLTSGQSASGEFTLTFDQVFSLISLDAAFLRFQSIDGSPYGFQGASGVGFNVGDINLQAVPLNPVPLPASAVLFGSGVLGLIVLNRRRRKRRELGAA